MSEQKWLPGFNNWLREIFYRDPDYGDWMGPSKGNMLDRAATEIERLTNENKKLKGQQERLTEELEAFIEAKMHTKLDSNHAEFYDILTTVGTIVKDFKKRAKKITNV